MEYTRENVIKSLRACAERNDDGSRCRSCLCSIMCDSEECKELLMLRAAAMLEEIGKGELPRKPVEIEKEGLLSRYARTFGKAQVLVGELKNGWRLEKVSALNDGEISGIQLEATIAYHEGLIEAATAVLELRSREK